ncbi:restriction endonuclease subunit S [Vibrio vulnificus]|uniref:restriction endonuclease subunit S n=1 Tax=Vibrio vulnificus TaxID=672 RepID=UPI00163BF34D|nr:restriction endonuclease subunit S [Vibrio vulnificus]QNE00235.1 restriction endonuclease subunit S [Vibrio vulnificus]
MNRLAHKAGWRELRLSDVIKVKSGDSLSKSKMEDGEFPVFGGNGVSGYHSTYNTDETKIVIGRVGEYCGAVHKTPQYSWITDNALYVHEKKVDINDEYLFFLLDYLALNKYANRNAQPLVSGKTLEQIACTLPSCLIEQQKIAEVLSTVDKKIDLLDQKIAETEKLKTGLMQKLFSEGVGVQDENGNWQPHTEFQASPFGKIPKCWSVETLGEHTIKVGSGVTPKGGSKAYVDTGIPLIRSQNVLFGKFKLDDVAFITEQQHEKMKGSQLQPKDVLLNITGASIGRCAVLPADFEEGNVNQHVCIIRMSQAITPEFCGWFLNSNLGQKQIWNLQAGGNREGLNFQQIRSFRIPVLTVEEQCSIVEILSTVSDKLNLLEQQKVETQKLKKGLMQKLLTGEWRVPIEETEAA